MSELNTNETLAVDAASPEIPADVHAHIDFSSINFNDPAAIEAINLDGVTCEACLSMYDAHFGSHAAASADSSILSGLREDISPLNFVSNLGYMGTGMLGIFIVIALIMGVTTALNKFFSGKPKADEN